MPQGAQGRSGLGVGLAQVWSLGPNEKIIGVRDADLVHKASDSGADAESGLTETTFDTSTRADAAKILLTNSTGSSVTLTAVSIRAKPVTMLRGTEGWIHDAFFDQESIEKHGEKELTFGNDDVVTKTQVEQIADYLWKYAKTSKHLYVATMHGMCHWIQPGEWYRLQIGGAGFAENIDSVVECFNVRSERRPGGIGETVVIFREVEEAWKNDSNALARFLASGGPTRPNFQSSKVITVGSRYFPGQADIYCDGTSDQEQINTAITLLSGSGIQGTVSLTAGTFYIDGSIDMKSGVAVEGQGIGITVIEKNCDDYAIDGVGTVGTHITNTRLARLTLSRNTSDTNSKDVLFYAYHDNAVIESVYFNDIYYRGLHITDCDRTYIIDCEVFEWSNNEGVYLEVSSRVTIDGLIIDNNAKVNNVTLYGLRVRLCTESTFNNVAATGITMASAFAYPLYFVVADSRIANIKVYDCSTAHTSGTTPTMWGVLIGGAGNQASNISVTNIDNTTTAAYVRGVWIDGADDNTLSSVYVTGCSGTGIEIGTADGVCISSGRSTGNGTNYTDGGTNTQTAAFYTT